MTMSEVRLLTILMGHDSFVAASAAAAATTVPLESLPPNAPPDRGHITDTRLLLIPKTLAMDV